MITATSTRTHQAGVSVLLWPRVVAMSVIVLALYAWRLSDAPVYLSPDEAIISVDAHTLATTGRDVVGQLLPLYFKIQMPGETRSGWFTPAIFYWSAAFLKVLPLREWSVRLPTACIGVIDVVLLYLIGRKLFDREVYALFAAAALALAPAHFMLSRFALDYIYPLPFVLGWLLCLLTFFERRQLPWLVGSTTLLGLGFYSYIASVLLMPLYLAFTLMALVADAANVRTPARSQVAALIGFAVPLLPFAAWFLRHPTALSDTAGRYNLYDPAKGGLLQGIRDFLGYPNLDRLSGLYWSYFSPSFLFFSGDAMMTFSTRSVGVLLLPLAVLLVAGLYHAIVRRRTRGSLLVVAGFVTAPVAAVLVPESAAIIRAVALMPFAALLAAYGLELLWSARVIVPRAWWVGAGVAGLVVALPYAAMTLVAARRIGASTLLMIAASAALLAIAVRRPHWSAGRVAAIALVALIPMQFASFAADYFGDYRIRSSSWFGGNLPGALEQLIDRAGRNSPTAVCFATLQSTAGLMDTRNRWMNAYWRFYLGKHGREDLLARTSPFDASSLAAVPAGSLVLTNLGDRNIEPLIARGDLRLMATIPELDREPFFVILERSGRQ